MEEDGVAAAPAGHLHDQLVVMVADLAELRAFMVAAAHPAAIIPSLGPQELQDGVFHRRRVPYKRGKGASLMAEWGRNRCSFSPTTTVSMPRESWRHGRSAARSATSRWSHPT